MPIEHCFHTVDQSHPVLSQIIDLDNLEIREEEDNDDEIESNTQEEEVSDDNHDNEEEIELKRSSRIPWTSTRLRDFITYKVRYHIQDFISYDNISSQYMVFVSFISQGQEPINYLEAIKFFV
jgi:hypothetical protein